MWLHEFAWLHICLCNEYMRLALTSFSSTIITHSCSPSIRTTSTRGVERWARLNFGVINWPTLSWIRYKRGGTDRIHTIQTLTSRVYLPDRRADAMVFCVMSPIGRCSRTTASWVIPFWAITSIVDLRLWALDMVTGVLSLRSWIRRSP